MSDFFREVEEDIRRDRLTRQVRRYGPIALAVAAVIVLAVSGTIAWKGWQSQLRARETNAFADAVEQQGAAGGPKAAAEALAGFVHQVGVGPRAALARFYEAGLRARNGENAAALALYEQLAADSGTDPVLRDLAQVLAVLHQPADAPVQPLITRLEPLTQPANPWHHSALELTALLVAQSGDTARAAGLFRQLADDATAPEGVRARAADLATLYHRK